MSPGPPHRTSSLVGSAAPHIDAQKVAGDGPTTIAQARGRVLIIDFWATFCDPCRRSFPSYQRLVDRYQGKVAVIAVALDEPENASVDDLLAFGRELGVRFPLLWDTTGHTKQAYDPPAMPTAYVIDRGGVVRYAHDGYHARVADKITQEVAALLR